MKNLFNNQLGFSLVQGMIVAGVVAGSGLVATRLITDQKLSQKSAETRDQIEDLHSLATSTLQNRDNCKETFWADRATLLTTTSGPGMILPSIQSVSGPTLVRHNGTMVTSGPGKNTYMNGNVIVKDMRVLYSPGTGKANLAITYERLNATNEQTRTKSGYGAKEIKKNIELRVQRNPFDTLKPFESCYGVASSKATDGSMETGSDINREFCLSMNGGIQSDGAFTGDGVFVWDETTSTCLPNAKCPDHLVFTGFDPSGQVQCKHLADVMPPADMANMVLPATGNCGPNQTISIVTTTDKTKVRVVCTP